MQGVDQSPPPILQWFESSYQTIESRLADIFMAGYGFVWLPPPYRADQGGFSVGYDVYDRFDLGKPANPTLYGTEEGLKTLATMLHRAGVEMHVDYIINHNGFSNLGTAGFAKAGGYPGFALTLPNDVDGDFNSAFAGGVERERLAGLIDIAHEKNHRFIRSPVAAGNPKNLPAGTVGGIRPDCERARPAKPAVLSRHRTSDHSRVRPANGRAEHRRCIRST